MKTRFWSIIAAAAAMLVMTGCDRENGKENQVVFPELEGLSMAAGESREVSFSASHAWTLSSDQGWCMFDDNGVSASTISGPAGNATVTIVVNGDGLDFSEVAAKVSMTMAEESRDVFTVTRLGKERICELYCLNDGDELVKAESMSFSFNGHTALSNTIRANFKANFPWKVKSAPEQLDVKIENWHGEADAELSKYGLEFISVKETALAAAFEGEIVVCDLDGNNEFKFAVNYAGLGDDDIKLVGEGIENGINFSYDAFLCERQGMDYVPSEEKSYRFSVLTKGGEFQYLVADVYDYTPRRIPAPDWLHITKGNNGETTVTVDENAAKKRTVYLLFFPMSVDLAKVSLYDYFDDYDCYFLGNKNAFQLNQNAAPLDGGWRAGWGGMLDSTIPIVKFDDYSGKELLGGSLGVISPFSPEDNTYVCEFTFDEYKAIEAGFFVSPIGFEGEEVISTTRFYPIEASEDFAEGSQLYDLSDYSMYPAIMLDLSILGLAEENLAEGPFFFSINTYLSEEEMNSWGKAYASLIIVIKK